jgi:intracellular sulfur oxidation DsrE/DsrF family protein
MTMRVNKVKNIRAKPGKKADIVVVVNVPAVSRFTNLSSSRAQLDEMLELNANVSVCSFALKNRNLLKVNLLKGTTYLEDGGVTKTVKLQQAGYAYILLGQKKLIRLISSD